MAFPTATTTTVTTTAVTATGDTTAEATSAERPRTLTIFSLPLELRQQIYKLALTPSAASVTHLTPSDIHVSLPLPAHVQADLTSGNYWTSRSLRRRLRLLRASRQVHDEAARVLYGAFTFSYPPWDDALYARALAAWLAAPASAPYRAGIRSVRLARSVALTTADEEEATQAPASLRVLGARLRRLRRVTLDLRFHPGDDGNNDGGNGRRGGGGGSGGDGSSRPKGGKGGGRDAVVQRVLALARPFARCGARVELRLRERDRGCSGVTDDIVREAAWRLGRPGWDVVSKRVRTGVATKEKEK